MKKLMVMAMVAVMTLITCTSTVEWKDDDQNVTVDENGSYWYHGLDTFYLHTLVEEGYRVEFTD